MARHGNWASIEDCRAFERDVTLYGNALYRTRPDGLLEHVPYDEWKVIEDNG